jgi:hypothetical protein
MFIGQNSQSLESPNACCKSVLHDISDNIQAPPFFAECYSFERVKQALANGVNIQQKDMFSRTLLMYLCGFGFASNVNTIQYLSKDTDKFQFGAYNSKGEDCLFFAIKNER